MRDQRDRRVPGAQYATKNSLSLLASMVVRRVAGEVCGGRGREVEGTGVETGCGHSDYGVVGLTNQLNHTSLYCSMQRPHFDRCISSVQEPKIGGVHRHARKQVRG